MPTIKIVTEGAAPPEWLSSIPDLRRSTGAALHTSVSRWLSELMRRGELTPGDRLPREDELARLLCVSRMTLRQALSALESQGVIERRTGRKGGTFVREPRIECDLTGLAGFTEQMRRANLRAGARVISAETVAASPAASRALGLRRGEDVHRIVRVRTASREPMAVENTYLPAAVFPDFLAHRLTGSIYELMDRRYGQRPVSAIESLEAVIAGPEDCALLGVGEPSPLICIVRTSYSAAGLPVEFARDVLRPERIKISLRTSIAPATTTPAVLAVAPAQGGR